MQATESIVSLIQTYNELNPLVVDELAKPPTALQFQRYVTRNRPFIVRHAAREWPAVRTWDARYLRNVMRGRNVKVATTPSGNADAVVEVQPDVPVFVQPHEVEEDFATFLDYIQEELHPTVRAQPQRNVKYAQTQNDNLRDEYSILFSDVPTSIEFADVALEKAPDAINFWLGNQRSVTALHKDNYENIYVQVRGAKHFTLLPPTDMPCVNETLLLGGRYHLKHDDGSSDELMIVMDEDENPFPVAMWDPDDPEVRASPYSRYSSPLKVVLHEGDMMYLPAMWYHKVAQECGEEGFACSVNYWYDMDFSGSFWAQNAFVRDIVNAAAKAVEYPDLDLSET